MSTVVVISIENVLTAKTDRHTPVPIAAPDMTMVRFVTAVSTQFSIGYVTASGRAEADAWLKDVGAPLGAWILPDVARADRSRALTAQLGRLRDRCVLFVADSAEGFDRLAAAEIPTMLYHSGKFVLGDWKQRSSWEGPDDDHDDLVGRDGGGGSPEVPPR